MDAADFGGEDEFDVVAAAFFVVFEVGWGDFVHGCCGEAGLFDEVFDALGVFFTEEFFLEGDLIREDHADGDGVAVEQGVVGDFFECVAEGVAVVEDHAVVAFFFVFADDGGFDFEGFFDDVGEGFGVEGENFVEIFFEVFEEGTIFYDAVFDHFGEAGAELGFG